MNTNADTPHTLRRQRDELYQAAREHPGSEEEEMVEILLLSAMSNMQPVSYDATPGLALGDERRRFRAARERSAQERPARPKVPGKGTRGAGTAARHAGASVAQLQREIGKRDRRLEKIEEALKHAQAARSAGKQVTDMEIYNRIATVIGLKAPLKPLGPADESER